MPVYSLTGHLSANFSNDSTGDSLFQEVSFGSPANVGEFFTFIGGGGTVALEVDEPLTAAAPDQLEENVTTQTLDQAITVDGTNWAAGTLIVTGWRVTMSGDDGETYVMSSISLGNKGNGNNPVHLMVFHNKNVPPDGTVLTVTQEVNGVAPNGIPYVCFTRGALITTVRGPRRIETLRPGDLVITADNGLQPIRWIGRKKLSPLRLALNVSARPILVPKGTLGAWRDTLFSPQHRLFLAGKELHLLHSEAEMLIAAKHLLSVAGIRSVVPDMGVQYFHLAFDRHELIFADGVLSESLYLGPVGVDGIGIDGQRELEKLGLITPEQQAFLRLVRPQLIRDHQVNDVIHRVVG